MELGNLGEITKYRFSFKACQNIPVPVYKGSLFHGGFASALKEIAPTWLNYFFPTHKRSKPQPYVLLPPLDHQRVYANGHIFHCELTLVGEAAGHYSICQAALEYLVSRLGLGYKRRKAKLIGVEQAVISTDFNGEEGGEYTKPQEIAASRSFLANKKNIAFHFITRLRLKHGNKLVRSTPSFELFYSRILGRINTLAFFYGAGEVVTAAEKYELLELAKKVKINESAIKWDDWSRFSGRQRSWMKFGGLLGHVTYQGDLSPFVPFLALGEWVHVGGKTSFGLGKYVMKED